MSDAAEAPDQAGSRRPPWNPGRLLGQKPPLKLGEVWAMRARLRIAQRLRDLALFNLAVDSRLRGCDVVSLRVENVVLGARVRPRATVLQRKKGCPEQFEPTEQTREAVTRWIAESERRSGDYPFPSRIGGPEADHHPPPRAPDERPGRLGRARPEFL